MDQEMCMKIADDITNKLIKLCRTKKVNIPVLWNRS